MKVIFKTIMIAFLVFSTIARGDVEDAAKFIMTACLAGGEEIKLDGNLEAGFTLRNISKSGVNGSISFSKTEAWGIGNALKDLSETQATQTRDCMRPYINRMIDLYLSDEERELNEKKSKKECGVSQRCEADVMSSYRTCLDSVEEAAEEKGQSSDWVSKTQIKMCDSNLKNIRGCYEVKTLDELNRKRASCKELEN